MKYSEGKHGRLFVMRLENGEVLHKTIEEFAEEHMISAAVVFVIGGIDKGSKLVVGPKDGADRPIVPMERVIDNVHEISGVGTIFPDEGGRPISHIHVASGRGSSTKTGCVRRGVKVWQVVEVVVLEILGTSSKRRHDGETGFDLLETLTIQYSEITSDDLLQGIVRGTSIVTISPDGPAPASVSVSRFARTL